MYCKLCGTPVTPSTAHTRVEAWERPGKGAGGQSGSSLVLRRRLEEFACVACITRLQAGLVEGQEALL